MPGATPLDDIVEDAQRVAAKHRQQVEDVRGRMAAACCLRYALLEACRRGAHGPGSSSSAGAAAAVEWPWGDSHEVGAELTVDAADPAACHLRLRVLPPHGKGEGQHASYSLPAGWVPPPPAHQPVSTSGPPANLARAALARILLQGVEQRRQAQSDAGLPPLLQQQQRYAARITGNAGVLALHKRLRKAWREQRCGGRPAGLHSPSRRLAPTWQQQLLHPQRGCEPPIQPALPCPACNACPEMRCLQGPRAAGTHGGAAGE